MTTTPTLNARPSPKPARPVRLLLADVDGTLVTREKLITDRARMAVMKLREAGIAFAVTSGRPPMGMGMLIAPLGLTTPMAAFNGGILFKPDFSVLSQWTLTREAAEAAVRVIQEHHIDAWVYRGNDWLVRTPHGSHVDREQWTVKFAPKVVPDFAPYTEGVAKVVGASDDLEAVAKCEAAVRAALGGTVAASRSQPYYLDVTNPEANKGTVVTRLAGILGVKAEEVATIGDMANDVLMFERSGFSIAMGNASDEVKARATAVTASNEEEGFARAVEGLVLG